MEPCSDLSWRERLLTRCGLSSLIPSSPEMSMSIRGSLRNFAGHISPLLPDTSTVAGWILLPFVFLFLLISALFMVCFVLTGFGLAVGRSLLTTGVPTASDTSENDSDTPNEHGGLNLPPLLAMPLSPDFIVKANLSCDDEDGPDMSGTSFQQTMAVHYRSEFGVEFLVFNN